MMAIQVDGAWHAHVDAHGFFRKLGTTDVEQCAKIISGRVVLLFVCKTQEGFWESVLRRCAEYLSRYTDKKVSLTSRLWFACVTLDATRAAAALEKVGLFATKQEAISAIDRYLVINGIFGART